MGVARVGRGGSKAAQVTTETVTTGTAERRELTAARWSVVEVHAVVPLARARFNSGAVLSVGRRGGSIWIFSVTD